MRKKFILFLLLLPFFVKAGSVSLTGTKTVAPGETTTLSVVVSSSNKIVGAQMVVAVDNDNFEILMSKTTSSYDIQRNTNKNSFLVYTTGDNYIPNNGTAAKIYVKAKANATPGAKTNLTLKNVGLTTMQNGVAGDENASTYSTALTVGTPKSTNNYLATLEITGYAISFNKNTTSYTLNLNEPGAALKVTATAEDEKATVKVSSPTLVEGTNKITVTVTAESGAKRVYTVNVVIPKKEEVKSSSLNLKTLEVKGYNIAFDPSKTEYFLTVENSVKAIEILSTLEDDKSTKSVTGPNELVDGENVYTITVTDNTGNKKVYKITVNRKAAEKVCEECKVCETCKECEDGDNIWKFLAVALVIVTLAETIYMVTMRDKKQL